MIIIFNLIGAGVLILALAIGAGVGYLLGAKTEAPTMLVGGLLAIVLDLIYRMNGETFAAGETHNVKVAQGRVSVTCVEIHELSVIAKITGQPHPVELKFGEPTVLQATN